MSTATELGWRRPRPTVAGAYWMRESDGSKKLVYLGHSGRGLYVTIGTRVYPLISVAFDGCDWFGPMAPPRD